ncbi:MAG: cytochrome C [Cyclobacteriaceae bacterium]|nr:cytochrome C [Cyclobacteriaceae bacterium]
MSEFSKRIWVLYKAIVATGTILILLFILIIILSYSPDILRKKQNDITENAVSSSIVIDSEFKDGIHIPTGFKQGSGVEQVIITCTACHSSKMVTQNRATREGWESMIRWMQQTQNLWDLGENEKIILDYLEKYYSPEKLGRRKNLEEPDWYVLQ